MVHLLVHVLTKEDLKLQPLADAECWSLGFETATACMVVPCSIKLRQLILVLPLQYNFLSYE